ncbi:SDR family oxidoreductase [Daejeonella lutea]|uniref:Uncharacterized conserved protein YbjT, contains NAD(P)-binding and DUF2867 domains n=1 Tax=Daejeonella lutea TaxID=572036 RepID=A0A1T5CX15_9SPHI|nr:NAD(P)H-binding protein [Daejeonella lutea]SKB63903.1 Uncharacterized conserved protein YbjT, contains NAD(P)-binding and DUF2867 domains [Daejeonella lutea]
MRILVIGATGLIGKNVAKKLTALGHDVVAGSPGAGIDIITGEGLTEALKGTEIVIDLSNSSSPDDETAISFFSQAGKTLIAAEKQGNIRHHVVLSIVGIDKALNIGYLRAKKGQEDNVRQSGIPYTIIRSTQFHEHVNTIIAVQSQGAEVHVSTVDYQPIAAEDVAELISQIALEQPLNGTVEIAGPERAPMNEIVSRYLAIRQDSTRTVVANDDDKYMHLDIPKSLLVPDGDYREGKVRFDEWSVYN